MRAPSFLRVWFTGLIAALMVAPAVNAGLGGFPVQGAAASTTLETHREAIEREVSMFYHTRMRGAFGLETDEAITRAINFTVDALYPVVETAAQHAEEAGLVLPPSATREAVRHGLLSGHQLFSYCHPTREGFHDAPRDTAQGLDAAYGSRPRNQTADPTCLIALTELLDAYSDGTGRPAAAALSDMVEGDLTSGVRQVQEKYIALTQSGEPFNLVFKAAAQLVKDVAVQVVNDDLVAGFFSPQAWCLEYENAFEDPRANQSVVACETPPAAEGVSGSGGGAHEGSHPWQCAGGPIYDETWTDLGMRLRLDDVNMRPTVWNTMDESQESLLLASSTAFSAMHVLRKGDLERDCFVYFDCERQQSANALVYGNTLARQRSGVFYEQAFLLTGRPQVRSQEVIFVEKMESRSYSSYADRVFPSISCTSSVSAPRIVFSGWDDHVTFATPRDVAFPATFWQRQDVGPVAEGVVRTGLNFFLKGIKVPAPLASVLASGSAYGVGRVIERLGEGYVIVEGDEGAESGVGIQFKTVSPAWVDLSPYAYVQEIKPVRDPERLSECFERGRHPPAGLPEGNCYAYMTVRATADLTFTVWGCLNEGHYNSYRDVKCWDRIALGHNWQGFGNVKLGIQPGGVTFPNGG